MSGLFSTLNVAARALGATRAVHATAAHNVENAATPGYARQRAELAAAQPATMVAGSLIGSGVSVSGISRARDRFLDAQLPAALSSAAFSSSAASTMTAVTTLDPDDDFGIPASLGKFYAAMRMLGSSPSEPGARAAAVAGAEALARSIQRTAVEVAGARGAADDELQARAVEASQLAARVASLNAAVRRSPGPTPNDLLDARRLAAEELAALTGGTILEPGGANGGNGGDLTVQLGAHALVIGDRSARFETQPNGANGGHLDLVVVGSDGARSVLGAAGGRLGGIIAGRDDGLGAVEARLDAFAFDLASSLNAAHAGGIALDGSSGRDLFDVGVQAGAAGRIRVNVDIAGDPALLGTSATGAPGDNGGVLALVATETSVLASGADAASTLSRLIGDFGSAARRALDESDAAESVALHVSDLRSAVVGVSIDEELIEMTKAQRAFEAVSKVIQTTDEMLNTLLSLR